MKNALPRAPIFVTKKRAPTGGLSHQTSLLNVKQGIVKTLVKQGIVYYYAYFLAIVTKK